MDTILWGVFNTLLKPPLSCPTKIGEEDSICIKFANCLRGWTVEGKLNSVWFHVPNEVSDGKKFHFGNKLKAMGKIPGVSDYVFGSGKGMWCLEVKSKGGKLSPNQEAWKKWCELLKIPYVVVRSVEEGEKTLKEWGILI